MKFGNGKITFESAIEKIISGDAITITLSNHKLQPEAGVTDNLSTINGTVDGDFGILYASDFGTDTITIKHNVGNILCVGGADISLSYGSVNWYSNGTKIFVSGGGGAGNIGYKIVPTVSANDLILSLKHEDGTDPSAVRPLYFKIGDTQRAVTAALSVTKADATNWANLGSAELATYETDLFPYLIWNTNLTPDAVDIGWSRIPYGNLYSDFSATTTNEKYLAINATAPAATDDCVNIGRFAATLSAGAGYTWTVPTYTGVHLIQRPIYETRLLSWKPVHTRTVTAYTNVPTINTSAYQVIGRFVWINERHTQNATPGGTGNQQFTLPFTQLYATFTSLLGLNEDTPRLMTALIIASSNIVRMFLYEGTTEVTASNSYSATGIYAV